MGKGERCSGFVKQICHFITRKSSVTRDLPMLIATWKERESERSQISQKDFGWRNAAAVERNARNN